MLAAPDLSASGEKIATANSMGLRKESAVRIGLVDVDGHNFPNLALMKISAYHKKRDDQVEWWAGNFIHNGV